MSTLNDLTKRPGVIQYSILMMEKHPSIISEALSILKIIPLHVENNYARNVIELTCYCGRFEVVPEGYIMPRYEIEVNCDHDGNGGFVISTVDVAKIDDESRSREFFGKKGVVVKSGDETIVLI